jgi:hypothetical protein
MGIAKNGLGMVVVRRPRRPLSGCDLHIPNKVIGLKPPSIWYDFC